MMTTESERSIVYDKAYDIGDKGYLTKFERQLKELDDDVEVPPIHDDDYMEYLRVEERRIQDRR